MNALQCKILTEKGLDSEVIRVLEETFQSKDESLAGLSIVCLRGAARERDASLILFWLFLLGTLLSFPLCYQELKLLKLKNSSYIVFSALCGVGAQWLLTLSYSRLEAVTGSLISTIRIPLALLMGLLLLGESFLWNEYLGAAVIFMCNILLAFRLPNRAKANPL